MPTPSQYTNVLQKELRCVSNTGPLSPQNSHLQLQQLSLTWPVYCANTVIFHVCCVARNRRGTLPVEDPPAVTHGWSQFLSPPDTHTLEKLTISYQDFISQWFSTREKRHFWLSHWENATGNQWVKEGMVQNVLQSQDSPPTKNFICPQTVNCWDWEILF